MRCNYLIYFIWKAFAVLVETNYPVTQYAANDGTELRIVGWVSG